MRLLLFVTFLAVCLTLIETASLPKLDIYSVPGSPAYRRILAQDGTKPFFWNGDTPWLLFHQLQKADVEYYLNDRASKQFNVIQVIGLSWADVDYPNAYGEYLFSPNHSDPTQPNDKFWANVDEVMDMAEDKGIYVAFWPVWGSDWISRGGYQPDHVNFFNTENVYIYGKYLGNRYSTRTNLIWILGGDIDFPVNPADKVDIYRAMAEGIGQGVSGGARPQWNNTSDPTWQKLLMSLHPTSGLSSSMVFENDAWLRFNLIQSGWGRWQQIIPLIHNDYKLTPIKPTFMGEGAYEWDVYTYCGMPNNTNDQWGVRFNAYWSVFAGGFGTTYGANNVYQFDSSWKQALQYPGAGQVQYLKALMEMHDWIKLEPDFDNSFIPISASGNTTDCALVIGTCAVDGSFCFAYNTKGIPFEANLKKLSSSNSKSRWYNPRSGAFTDIGVFPNTGLQKFDPQGIPGNENDWVLVLEAV